jgi:dTDP-L-rhamnose 4-epimerase
MELEKGDSLSYKVLVTGGAGFIGSHIVDKLVDEGHEVTIIDNLEPQVHPKGAPEYVNREAKFILGDVRDREKIEELVEDSDVIFHEAAMVGVGQSMYQIEKYLETNVIGTGRLLEILANKEHNVKKLVVASSMSIYGEGKYECENCGVVYPKLRSEEQLKKGDWEMNCPACGNKVLPLPTDEDKPLFPTSVYAVSKRDQEEICLAVGKAYGIPTVALRYFNVYGSRQSLSNPYTGVCAIFSSRVRNNRPPIIFEDGLQTRDFIDVRDIVQANMLALEKSKANYNAFNVGTGKATSILEIARIIAELYESKLKPEIVNKYRAGDIRHCFANISKIRKIGFKPSIELKDGMRNLAAWGEREEAIDKFDEAHTELQRRGLVL